MRVQETATINPMIGKKELISGTGTTPPAVEVVEVPAEFGAVETNW